MADQPDDLVELVAAGRRPVLLALDVDGVLSPIVAHADDACLSPGVGEVLARLAVAPGVHVAVVSGRSLAGLAQFDFDDHITVVGSHGAEITGDADLSLSTAEGALLADLTELAERAARDAGPGAWVEYKPASVVLHVRKAEADRGVDAAAALRRHAATREGAMVKPGSAVVELMARPAHKGVAVDQLRERVTPASIVFVGDDVTDEDGFRALREGDVGIKVGEGPSAATHRLADPAAVRSWLSRLSSTLSSG